MVFADSIVCVRARSNAQPMERQHAQTMEFSSLMGRTPYFVSVVLSIDEVIDEVRSTLLQMVGTPHLIAELLYETGLR